MPEDWVCREIETALAAAATVIPVLVDEARPVDEATLRTVPSLASLSKLQAIPLRRKDWGDDVQRLQAFLEKHGFVARNSKELSEAITYLKVKEPDFAKHCKFFLDIAKREGEVGFHHGFSTLKNEAGQALINLGALEYIDEFQSKRVKSRLKITKLGEELLMYLSEHAAC
jgi:hypothetical protein